MIEKIFGWSFSRRIYLLKLSCVYLLRFSKLVRGIFIPTFKYSFNEI